MQTTTKKPTFLLLKSFLYVLFGVYSVGIIVAAAVIVAINHHANVAMPADYLYISMFIFALNIIAVRNMLHWNKWGFWLFCILAVISMCLSLYLYSYTNDHWYKVLSGFIPCLIVYGLFQVGGKKKAWQYLA